MQQILLPVVTYEEGINSDLDTTEYLWMSRGRFVRRSELAVSGSMEQLQGLVSPGGLRFGTGVDSVGGKNPHAASEQRWESSAGPGACSQLPAVVTSKAVIAATWQHWACFPAFYS